ncbi:hypothetical protein EVAR_19026_1 [Eumeta japonica]|uniref:Uncharacterized protein n=1 Tax=Eumeta variegata TaxID=151549 RepID=A0A4C1VAG7_EUMVA|nr:hypothetical protein EVAR_19026_1 [Eumeta japonica]
MSKLAGEVSDSRLSLPPMNTRNFRGVTNLLGGHTISKRGGIRFIKAEEGSGPPELSIDGRNATVAAATSLLYSVRVCGPNPVSVCGPFLLYTGGERRRVLNHAKSHSSQRSRARDNKRRAGPPRPTTERDSPGIPFLNTEARGRLDRLNTIQRTKLYRFEVSHESVAMVKSSSGEKKKEGSRNVVLAYCNIRKQFKVAEYRALYCTYYMW